MRAMLRLLLTLSIVGATAIAPLATPRATAGPSGQSWTNTSYQPVLVVLDTSGSMSEDSGDGSPRIDAARSAVRELATSLEPNTPFGMLAYPGRNSRSVDGCVQGRVEAAVKKVDLADVSAALRQLNPDGDTPTGPALTQAAGLLKARGDGHGTIVLVSDGESNCGAPPCEVAKKLSSEGFEVVVNTIGFRISDEGARELRCISNTTGGTYVDVTDPNQLKNAMQDSSGARLELTVSVPEELAAVSGTSGGTPVRLTVQNTGQVPAQDARVSLDFRSADDKPGAILIPRPVRFLGNLDPRIPRTIDITVRPRPEQANARFSWTAIATAANAAPVVESGKSTVVEPFGHLTGLLAGITDVAILGDSYSSGEGTHDYLPGTDDPAIWDNYRRDDVSSCHRSDLTYGRLIFPDADIIACSGAVTADFYYSQQSGGESIKPQLMSLRGLVDDAKPPQAVLLSIGGNDALFGPIVEKCTQVSRCESRHAYSDGSGPTLSAAALKLIRSLANDLSALYRDVDRAINDGAMRDRRGGRVAPIVVVPYPRIVPKVVSGNSADGCFYNISTDEVKFFNRFLDQMNMTIETVVNNLRKSHVPIYFAKDVIEAFQPDRTICDGDRSFANASTTHELAASAIGNTPPEFLHPNQKGYEAVARQISAWSARQTEMLDPALPPDWKQRYEFFVSAPEHSLTDLVVAGGRKSIFADGYDPAAPVILRLESNPRVVGSAIADSDGVVHADVIIPTDTPPGVHHLKIVGLGPDGALREQSIRVRVWPPHALAALVGLVAGVGLIAVATAGMVAGRGSRRRGE